MGKYGLVSSTKCGTRECGLIYWTYRSGLPGNGEWCRTVVRLLLINLNQVALNDWSLSLSLLNRYPQMPIEWLLEIKVLSKVKLKDYYEQ